MGNGIVAVLFDFDHTLGVDHRLEESVLRDLSAHYCCTQLSESAIAQTLATFRSGSRSLADTLATAFSGCACGVEIIDAYKAAALRRLPTQLEAMPGALDTLEALEARDYTVAILSNGWTELQIAKAALIGFAGPVLVSESIGAWKPDVRAFEIAGRELGIDLARSVYVGDAPAADVAGSKRAGMVAIWAALEGQQYPPDEPEPDASIHRLPDLVKAVEALQRGASERRRARRSD